MVVAIAEERKHVARLHKHKHKHYYYYSHSNSTTTIITIINGTTTTATSTTPLVAAAAGAAAADCHLQPSRNCLIATYCCMYIAMSSLCYLIADAVMRFQ